ncbi:unknown [Sutterella sp. CAG:397]|nr:unknown [Sutterella sp. CAG:397]
MPQKILRTVFIQHNRTVKAACHGKTGARHDVRFNKWRHNIHARALRGKHQVNARGTGFLRQTHDQEFNLLAVNENEVRQFINKADDVGEFFKHHMRLGIVGRDLEGIHQGLSFLLRRLHLFVIGKETAHPEVTHEVVAPVHFLHKPIEGICRLIHVDHDRAKEVRNIPVHRKFDGLGVNENEP